jgi:hypothetical protein
MPSIGFISKEANLSCDHRKFRRKLKRMQLDSEPVFDDSRVLPLFRPEVVAAQQKKLEGELLRIYPFSPIFLLVLAGIVFVCLLGIFQFGRTLP